MNLIHHLQLNVITNCYVRFPLNRSHLMICSHLTESLSNPLMIYVKEWHMFFFSLFPYSSFPFYLSLIWSLLSFPLHQSSKYILCFFLGINHLFMTRIFFFFFFVFGGVWMDAASHSDFGFHFLNNSFWTPPLPLSLSLFLILCSLIFHPPLKQLQLVRFCLPFPFLTRPHYGSFSVSLSFERFLCLFSYHHPAPPPQSHYFCDRLHTHMQERGHTYPHTNTYTHSNM